MSKPIQTQSEHLTQLVKPQKGSSETCFYADGDTSGFELVIGFKGEGEAVLLEELSK